jgi:hypothetical protein
MAMRTMRSARHSVCALLTSSPSSIRLVRSHRPSSRRMHLGVTHAERHRGTQRRAGAHLAQRSAREAAMGPVSAEAWRGCVDGRAGSPQDVSGPGVGEAGAEQACEDGQCGAAVAQVQG